MQILIQSCITFLLCYFILRYLKLSWEKQTLPPWSRFFLGFLAWGALISFLGIAAGAIFLVYLVMVQGDFGSILAFIGLSLGVGLIAKYANANPELFDYPSMKPFLKDSLAFVDPTRNREDVFDNLDRHEIRRVYREVTGNELSLEDERSPAELKKMLEASSGRAWNEDRTVRPRKELKQELAQPIASPHLHLELQQIEKGEAADFTDSWKINTLKKSLHEFFGMVTAASILPGRRLRLQIEGERFRKEQVQDTKSLYRLKQDLYEFLHAVHEVAWMKPYLGHADVIECTCVQLEVDAFSGVGRTPLLTVEITRAELFAHVNRYFNAGELKTTILVSPASR